jgi:hypothetical protein
LFVFLALLLELTMPPKKTTPVAMQKCGRCFKKHAPPLGEQCLALLLVDTDKNQNVEDEKNQNVEAGTLDHVNTNELDDNDDENLGAVGGHSAADTDNSTVAAQLANLTSVVSHLAGLFENTRQEVTRQELRAEVASLKQSRQVAVSSSSSASTASVTAPVLAIPAAHAVVCRGAAMNVANPDSLIPSLASLRADAGLVSQAEQLVANIGNPISGTCAVNLTKRGLVRCGGDLRPSVGVPWPQDYVLGSGSKLKVYYEDLSIYEWINGYIAIVQLQDPTTARHMLSHLCNLMEDAVFHGWETIKQAHSVILTYLETGEITWADEYALADKRRSAITRASRSAQPQSSGSQNKTFQQGNSNRQGRQHFNSGGFSNRAGGVGKKLIKPCLYHNNGVCSKKADHEEGNVFYRHICTQCMAADHTVKQCPFL